MGDRDDRPPLGNATQVVQHRSLRGRVEHQRRLVEEQDGRIFQERSGDGDPLALPAGQLRSAFADHRVQPSLHPADRVMQAGETGSRAWLLTATNSVSQPPPSTESRRLPVTRWLGRTLRPSFLVSMCRLAWRFVLVAHGRFAWLQVTELGQPRTGQHAAHR